eukprot:scaffold25258_cov101-Isochrysis_galbana.AAC.1
MLAPVGSAAPAAAAAPAEEAPPVVEKTHFTVKLDKYDAASKIKLIKEVRAITGLGLKEAKELVEGAPKEIKVRTAHARMGAGQRGRRSRCALPTLPSPDGVASLWKGRGGSGGTKGAQKEIKEIKVRIPTRMDVFRLSLWRGKGGGEAQGEDLQ